MKTIEMIITRSIKTKVSVKIDKGLSSKAEIEFVNGLLNEDPDKLIFDEPSEELLNINKITEWDIVE